MLQLPSRKPRPQWEPRSVPKRLRQPEGVASRRPVACGTPQTRVNQWCCRAHDRANPLSLHCPADSRAGDTEQVGKFSGTVLAAIKQGHQVRFLPVIELGLLTTQTPFGLGDLTTWPSDATPRLPATAEAATFTPPRSYRPAIW